MTPVDYRTATWKQIKRRLDANRMTVWLALQDHGPATTRNLAAKMKWEVTSVRPRVTELFKLGFAVLVQQDGKTLRRDNEGVYRALSNEESMQLYKERVRVATQEVQGELFGRARAAKVAESRSPRVIYRRLGRHKVWGFYSPEHRLIELDSSLKELPALELEILTHEGLHHVFPQLSEEEVMRAGDELSRILWNHNYRRCNQ